MISHSFEARLLRSNETYCNVGVEVELCYLKEDPLAVQLVIQTMTEAVVWTFARDLLMQGSEGDVPVGRGDVKIQRKILIDGTDLVVACLKSPEGHAHLAFPYLDVALFLDRTTEAIVPGSEAFTQSIDDFLGEVFGERP